MMRRIELLPASYIASQRQRRAFLLVLIAGLFVLLLLVVWYFRLGFEINDAKNELAAVQSENEALRVEITKLQPFADLQVEVQEKRQALLTVMNGDVDWPVLMTEVAMAVPGEVWLDTLVASAGQTEGSAPVGTETAPIDISPAASFGRIQFTGKSLSMPGVAKWLIRQELSKRFEAVFLNDASESTEGEGPSVFNFDSTRELNANSASDRFTERTLETVP